MVWKNSHPILLIELTCVIDLRYLPLIMHDITKVFLYISLEQLTDDISTCKMKAIVAFFYLMQGESHTLNRKFLITLYMNPLHFSVAVCLGSDFSRINNGLNAAANSYPFAVSIHWTAPVVFNDHFICGGVIVSKDWILTSAQCTKNIGSLTVKAGKHNISTTEKGAQVRQVTLQIERNDYKS